MSESQSLPAQTCRLAGWLGKKGRGGQGRFSRCARNSLALAAVMCAVSAGASQRNPWLPKVNEPITTLKELYPATALVKEGKPAAIIVIPATGDYRDLAETLRKQIKDVSGVELPIRNAEELVDPDWQIHHAEMGGNNLIALGNVNDNRLMSVLYGQRYVVADSIYPGSGGYVIRTVHDPWATGVNVLALAGSDPQGVRQAIEIFAGKHLPQAVSGISVVLPEPVVDVQFERKAYPFFPDDTRAAYSKRQPQYRTLEAIKKKYYPLEFDPAKVKQGDMTILTSSLAELADTYFRTGYPELLPIMKNEFKKYRESLKTIPEVHEMGGRSSSAVHGWDLIEELPIWTDDERLEIVNALLSDARQGNEPRPFHQAVREGYVQVLEENHSTFSALRSYHAWQYFSKYYDLPDSDYWMRCADAVFSGQASTFEILEDASGYLGYTPDTSMAYSLLSGDLTYFSRGTARNYAEYMSKACINNLGLSTGFGDAPSLVLASAFNVLASAAWMDRDPQLYWVLRNILPRGSGLRVFSSFNVFDLSVEPVEPTEWTGLMCIPLYESPLMEERRSRTKVFAEKKKVDESHFNKIVFKENWDRDGQYLLLDGAGVWGKFPGPHGHRHNDINTIINLTDQGRMWLVDHTYEGRAFADHSGVEMIREGQGQNPEKALAEIEVLAEDPAFAVTKTRIEDWERTIFWRKGEYLLILDRLAANEDGEHFARCTWKALGQPTLEGGSLYLEQDGKHCKIESDGGAGVEVVDRPYKTVEGWKQDYPYAEPVARMFIQDKIRNVPAGGSLAFANLIRAGSSREEIDEVTLAGASDRFALITEGGGQSTVLVGSGEIPGTQQNAGLYVVMPGAVHVYGAADAPDSGHAARILQAAQMLANKESGKEGADEVSPGSDAFEVRTVSLNTPVVSLAAADVNQDGQEEWVIGGEKAIGLYSAQGEAHWTSPTADRVRSVAAGKLDDIGGLTIVAGCDDERVHALSSEGEELWAYRCKPAAPGVEQPPKVDEVRIEDLDGDGANEVIAGATWVHVLSGDGELKWEQYAELFRGRIRGDVTTFDIADINGDGRKEVIAGFKLGYSVVRAMDCQGTVVLPVGGLNKEFHPGLYSPPPRTVLALPIGDDSNQMQILCATGSGLRCFRNDQRHTPDGRRPAGQYGGRYNNMVAFNPPGGGKPAVFCSDDYYGVRALETEPKGQSIRVKSRWYRMTPSGITALLTMDTDQDGAPEVYVGTRSGEVVVYQGDNGRLMGTLALPGEESPVAVLTQNATGTAVLAARQDGTISEIRVK